MNIEEAKKISIADYLHSLGCSPVKRQGANLWYKSPLREETEASFKVNTDLNKWYDFGLGKGGNIIALAGELYGSDHVPYLLGRMGNRLRTSVRSVSLSGSKGQSRASGSWKSATSPIRHCSVTCRGEVSTPNWRKENAGNCASPTTASPTSPSAFRMWQAATRCATPSSRAASRRKTSPTSGNKGNRGKNAWCSRGSWTTSRSSRSG